MTTAYDPIADRYRRAKEQPWRAHVEAYTLLGLVGDPAGLAVLDVACGDGFYARKVRGRGAARVVGVDLSAGMVGLARGQEDRDRLGIEYRVGDARDLPAAGFDLVVAAYLLNYARDRAELRALCDAAARSLRPGGRLVAVNSHPGFDFPSAPSYRGYGFDVRADAGDWREGATVRWTFHLPDGSFGVDNYHLGVGAHEEALAGAGFRSARWHPPRVSPDGVTAYGAGYWAPLLDRCPVAFLECVR